LFTIIILLHGTELYLYRVQPSWYLEFKL